MREITSTEHQEQVSLFEWAEVMAPRYPELRMMFAVPNGARTSMSVAKRLKAEGLKKGVPDVMLPVARGMWHGLFIEMKRPVGGRISPEQGEWIRYLTDNKYRCFVCNSWRLAADLIEKYLGGKL